MKTPVVIIGSFFLLLLTWLLLSGLNLNSDRYDREFQALDDFSELERGLNREVLTARAGLSRNYDALAHMTDAYAEALDRLRDAAGAGSEEVPARSRAVASPGIGRNEQPVGPRIDRRTHLLPPPPDARPGELRRVMVGPDADPALVPPQVIDPLGDPLAQLLVWEVLRADLLRRVAAMPLPPRMAKIPDQFLLFRIDRDDRLPRLLEGTSLWVDLVLKQA